MALLRRGFGCGRGGIVRDGVGVLLVYAVMALVDGLGVLSSRAGLVGISSTLFFLWFAVLPIPVGSICDRVGTVCVLKSALGASAIACLFLAVGVRSVWCSVVGFCLAGLANVCLQVAVPVLVAERFTSGRLAGVVTGGLFVKTAVAVTFPFAVFAFVGWGCWWLALVPFVVLSGVACGVTGSSTGEREKNVVGVKAGWRVLKDPVVRCATLAFAIAIVADVAFNLAVPEIVSRRFGGEGASVGLIYAVWFGVKLPLMLAGSRLFLRYDARRFFGVAVVVSLAGAVVMCSCEGWGTYLVGVGLFAAGFANVYGHVFGAAAPRHPNEVPAVSSLLVMAISAGALASPLLAAVGCAGMRAVEGLVLALVGLLLPFAAYLSIVRTMLPQNTEQHYRKSPNGIATNHRTVDLSE